MSIIIRIRKFLKIETKEASSNTDFADSVGLYLVEGMLRVREQTPSMDCLINHASAINAHHDFLQNSDSLGALHASHDIHF